MTDKAIQGSLPSGTVTFLFTDIEGSTELLKQLGDQYADLLSLQRDLLREIFERWDGQEVDTQGDSFFYSFTRASDALQATIEAQRRIARQHWPRDVVVRVRMALHTGEPQIGSTGYVGLDVHRAARICHVGHGGQVLLSETTAALVRHELPEATTLCDLGNHRLKDLLHPEPLYQLVVQDLPADFPPLNSLNAHPHNLPVQPTPLVGREDDIRRLHERFFQAEVRMLTLTGPGGVGKTRLGMQLAAEVIEQFPDGVYFIPLAPISDPNLVCPTIAKGLSLHERATQSILETIKEYLQPKRVFLLLDNFEHVIRAAPELSNLLEACPQLRLLITSREALHLRGEYEYPVQPLRVLDIDAPILLERLAESPALELFSQRARAANPTFAVTADNVHDVADICARLDGLPLSIELAAARIKVLPPKAMLDRLIHSNGGASLHLLSRGARDAPERHHTLHAAIGWSYDLLDEIEQELFRNLSVFAGGFDLPAVEAVCCRLAGAEAQELKGVIHQDVMDVIASLLDKSLLRSEEVMVGEARYSMLKMIREYAFEKLQEFGQDQEVQAQHAEHYLAMAEEAKLKLRGPEQERWLQCLENEHNNLRKALDWYLGQTQKPTPTHGDAALSGLRLVSALSQFWDTHGYLSEGRKYLKQFLNVCEDTTEDRVDALIGAAWLAGRQGDTDEAREMYEQALELSQSLDYKPGIARGLDGLGYLHDFTGDNVEQAESYWNDSLVLWRAIGDARGIATALGPLAKLASTRYDFSKATSLFEESLSLFRQVGDLREIAGALWNIGQVALDSGDYETARDRFEESMTIYEGLDDIHGIATQQRCLGKVERALGNTVKARALFEEGLTTFQAIGDKGCASDALAGMGIVALDEEKYSSATGYLLEGIHSAREASFRQGEAISTRLLGLVDLAQGDVQSAQNHLMASLSMERQHDNIEGIAACFDGLAMLFDEWGDYKHAAILYSASKNLRTSIGISLAPVDQEKIDRWVSNIRKQLGNTEFENAQEEGLELTVEQVGDLLMEKLK